MDSVERPPAIVRWTLRLKKGPHVYRSDAHAKVRRGFAVKQAG